MDLLDIFEIILYKFWAPVYLYIYIYIERDRERQRESAGKKERIGERGRVRMRQSQRERERDKEGERERDFVLYRGKVIVRHRERWRDRYNPCADNEIDYKKIDNNKKLLGIK